MKLNVIAAVCENQGIGINGSLPWNLRNELKHFNRLTKLTQDPLKKNALIMGRKTYFGIPKSKRPLAGRLNVILTKNLIIDDNHFPRDVILCSTFKEALDRLSEPNLNVENIWVIGGNSVYREAMSSQFCNRLYLTKIKADFECDTFFPEISEEFKVVEDKNVDKRIHEENGIKYEFVVLEKQQKQNS